MAPTTTLDPNRPNPTSVDTCLAIEVEDAPTICPICEGTGETSVFDGQATIKFPCGACRTYWEGPNT